jgi:hypothetical protein
MSGYAAFDGLPEGDYKVTVTMRDVELSGKLGPNLLPAKYASANTTDLLVKVKTGKNEIDLQLSSK